MNLTLHFTIDLSFSRGVGKLKFYKFIYILFLGRGTKISFNKHSIVKFISLILTQFLNFSLSAKKKLKYEFLIYDYV